MRAHAPRADELPEEKPARSLHLPGSTIAKVLLTLFALWALLDRLVYGSLGPEDPVDVVVREHAPGVEHVPHREKTIEVRVERGEVGG